VTDELNAFKAFETLDACGVRLSATDLLKNYLFSVISTQETHETELKALEERWERIVGLLGSESFAEFLRLFWNSRNKLVRKSDLFKTIRRRIASRNAAFKLLRDLDDSAAVYAALRDPQDSSWNVDEKHALEQLMMFNVRQPLAMLMACHARFYEHDRAAFTRIMKAVAVVSFRYNVICNLQTHEQERLYNDIAWKLSDGTYTSHSEVMHALQDVYPDDNQFKAAFTDKELRTTNSRNKKVVRYILFEIERQRSGQDFDFESATCSLGHILPEHPSEAWSYLDEAKQDRLFDADRAALLTDVVVAAVATFDVALEELHNDSTTVRFCGQYPQARGRTLRGKRAPWITHGYSKDHRPDLNQLPLRAHHQRRWGHPCAVSL
jgi:hypothetical protein